MNWRTANRRARRRAFGYSKSDYRNWWPLMLRWEREGTRWIWGAQHLTAGR